MFCGCAQPLIYNFLYCWYSLSTHTTTQCRIKLVTESARTCLNQLTTEFYDARWTFGCHWKPGCTCLISITILESAVSKLLQNLKHMWLSALIWVKTYMWVRYSFGSHCKTLAIPLWSGMWGRCWHRSKGNWISFSMLYYTPLSDHYLESY